MARRSSLRASDADRDRIAEHLREAVVEGRLLAHEFEERLARALRARTYGDLDAVVSDLPKPAATETRRRSGWRRLFAYPLLAAVVVVAIGVVAVAATALAILVLSVASVFTMMIRGGGGRRYRGRRLAGYAHANRRARAHVYARHRFR